MATYTQTGMGNAMMNDEQSASRMMDEAPRDTQAASGWVVDNVTIRKAKNGGFIVSCSKHKEPVPKNGSSYESNDYTFGSLAEAVPFIEQEFGASAAGGGRVDPPMPVGV